MNNKKDIRLGTPIFLDYDVNLTPIKVLHTEMLETIKNYLKQKRPQRIRVSIIK